MNNHLLYKHQFTEDELVDMLKERTVSQLTVIMTQKGLSMDFCLDYILEEKYSLSERDEYLDVWDVFRHQKHLIPSDYGL